MSKSLKIAAFLCAVMMVLASCGGKTEQTQTAQSGEGKEANKELKLLFPQMIEREGEILAGGTLRSSQRYTVEGDIQYVLI